MPRETVAPGTGVPFESATRTDMGKVYAVFSVFVDTLVLRPITTDPAVPPMTISMVSVMDVPTTVPLTVTPSASVLNEPEVNVELAIP